MTSNAAVLFGSPVRRPVRVRQLSPRTWTCVGLLAIPLWATWPALALRALSVPALECLTIAFAFGWLILARLQRASHSGDATMGSLIEWLPAIACAVGLTGSNAFHILATHYIPAA